MSSFKLLPLAAFPGTERTTKLYEEIASKMQWTPPGRYRSIVEREILAYDTFYLVNKIVGSYLTFGGGTFLNWVYLRDLPRFSFDIDSTHAGGETSKSGLLEQIVEKINRKIRQSGLSLAIGEADNEMEIGTVTLDLEKDHFEDVLSLKRSLPCLETGAELNTYLSKHRVKVEQREITKIRKDYGRIPKVEEVRIEIGLNQPVLPSARKSIKPLVADHIDVSATIAEVTKPETTAALKIIVLGKERTNTEAEHALVDYVKALCDLRVADHVEPGSVRRQVERLSGNTDVLDNALKRVRSFFSNTRLRVWYERGSQTQLIQKTHSFSDLVRLSVSTLEKVRGS